MQKDQSLGRTRLISILFILLSLLIIAKLFVMQVWHGKRFSEEAQRQYVTPSGGAFERGSIFFEKKDGELVSAATVRTGFKIGINPSKVIDAEAEYAKLQPILPDLNHDDFIKSATKKNDPYEDVTHQVDQAAADAVNALDDKALSVTRENWRFYPAKNIGSHVIGFTGFEGDTYSGRYGLERYYDDILRRDGVGLYVNFFAQVFSDVSKLLSSNHEEGGDLVTTIEPSVQVFLEDRMKSIQDKWHPEQGGAIIMDPKTGAIYAMSSYPNFDPNNYSQFPVGNFKNPLTENVYEMGSIIKPLIMAAGIDVGAVTPQTSYYDSGSVVVGDHTIRNFDHKGRGQVTMQDVLNQSLNTGMVYISQHMSKDDMRKYINGYKLGERTGIDLPSEATGLLSNLKSNRDIEFANMSFGQGIALTPIATIRAMAAIANGGHLVTPHIVDRIEYPTGFQKTLDYPVPEETVIKPETAETVTRMLVTVVDTTLMNGREKMEHYSVAAKTGTAQIPDHARGGYYTDRNLHSFFGFFPAYDPKFIVFMFVVYPKGAKYASETLAPEFFETSKFLLNYYNVSPDR